MTAIHRLSAAEIVRNLRAGAVSAVEVANAHIDRLDQVNPAINAVVQDGRDEALATAHRIDECLRRGADAGPLAGVPVTIKVNVDQAGFATTNGLTLQKDTIACADSPFVAHLRNAGAVPIGRTNTPAFSLRWFTNNSLHGMTLNPRDPRITPGGSSGGAAAAVAAGLCPIAHGTDIAGSIRYPAYACGVHGLRPSLGRVPAHNATAGDRYIGAQVMAVSGPIARRIEDIALAFHAMSGADARDPWYTPAPIGPRPFARRAALCLEPDGMSVAPEIKAALTAAARVLADAGWQIEEVASPPLRSAARINAILWMAETRFAVGDAIDREGNEDASFVFRLMCEDTGPVELGTVMTALQARAGLIREWETFLQDTPLMICPVSGALPFEQQADVRSEADFFRIYEAQLTQRALPVMGIPALSVATGTAAGKPVGVQLVSARFREDILLTAGAEIEAAMPKPEVAEPV